jgi:ribose/xylose/arabinose/galactoside ABC-type transport system permease subunit
MINKILHRVANWNVFLAAIFASVLVYAIVAVPHFATIFNLSQAAAGVSEKAILLLPMALLIIAREIDLSVASILALTSVVLGVLIRAGIPLAAAIPLVLTAGAAAGALNGFLVTRLNLPSLVVTLGTMALFRGLGYIQYGWIHSYPVDNRSFPSAGTGLCHGPAMHSSRASNLCDWRQSECRSLCRGQGQIAAVLVVRGLRTDVRRGRYRFHRSIV